MQRVCSSVYFWFISWKVTILIFLLRTGQVEQQWPQVAGHCASPRTAERHPQQLTACWGDWTSKQELYCFMNKAVIGEEQGLRVSRREALAWVFSGQGSFLGRSLMNGGGAWVRVRVFQATRMARTKDHNKIQGFAVEGWRRKWKSHHSCLTCHIGESGLYVKDLHCRKSTLQ